jgi:hypothetical protein
MPLLVVGLILVVGTLVTYRIVRPLQRRRKRYDVGAVSEDWLQRQRGTIDNHH